MTSPAITDRDAILKGIQDWVSFESPSHESQLVNRLVDHVESQYRAIGLETWRVPGRDGFGDHLLASTAAIDPNRGEIGGNREPGILLLSHLDTVHPVGSFDINPIRVEGDKAYGPGIFDMKGGAYLTYAALRHLAALSVELPLPVTHLLVSDEELGSPTSQALIEEQARQAKYVLVTEPARDGGRIVTSRKGTARFEMRLRGSPSHSGARHHEGRSAIKELARQILELESMTDYDRDITLNVGVVSGGTRENVVPEHARALIDLRVPDAGAAEEMVDRVLSLKSFDPDVELIVEGGMNRPAFEKLPEIANLFELAKRLAADIGFELLDTSSGGGSDGNFTATIAPTLDGLGVDGEGAHTNHEHMFVSSILPRANLQLRLLETLT